MVCNFWVSSTLSAEDSLRGFTARQVRKEAVPVLSVSKIDVLSASLKTIFVNFSELDANPLYSQGQ